MRHKIRKQVSSERKGRILDISLKGGKESPHVLLVETPKVFGSTKAYINNRSLY